MTGVVFIICIPKENYENSLKTRKKIFTNETYIVHRAKSHNEIQKADAPKEEPNLKERVKSHESVLNKALYENEEGYCRSSPNKEDYEYISMEKLTKDVLKTYKIEKSTFSESTDSHYIQLIFSMEVGDRCEEVLGILREHQIGQKYDSTISVIPCSLYYQGCEKVHESSDFEDSEDLKKDTDSAWTRFVASVRARLTVATIVEALKTDSTLTFDFLCLLVIAILTCAIGLVENGNIYLLSSILISPMMGPVMAGTFGTVIRDKMLQKQGLQNALIGLGVAVLVGFCYGAIACLISTKNGGRGWPTTEMITRGELGTLWDGCLIALLSGAALAVAVLSANIAPLVGVAISTALMPPAVNAGLLWSIASVYYLKGDETAIQADLRRTEYYSSDPLLELLYLGGISLCLTFVNIICIFAAGILVFKVKEVAPVPIHSSKRRFWKHDIKIAREFNRTLENGETLIPDEFINIRREMQDRYQLLHHSTDYSRERSLMVPEAMFTWSPCMVTSQKPTVQELQELYKSLISEKPTKNISPKINPMSGYRRLSQIILNDSSRVEEPMPSISEVKEKTSPSKSETEPLITNIVEDRSPRKDDKPSTSVQVGKFTVTPCNLEF